MFYDFHCLIIESVKQSQVLIFLIGGLLALLVLLAAAQYVWLVQISDAVSERLRKRLQTDTQNFAEDFNREIRGAYFTFQVDPGDWVEKDWSGFNDRYKLWKSQTAYPQLIKDFYFVGKNSPPIRYDADERNFKVVEWTEELREVELKITDEKNNGVKPIVINTLTLLMPNYASGMETSVGENNVPVVEASLSGFLAIKLDEKAVNQFLSDLNLRYFSGEPTRYNLSISSKSDSKIIYPKNQDFAITAETSDQSVSLFDLSMSNYTMAINSSVFSSNKKTSENKPENTTKNPPPKPKMTKDDTVKVQMTDSRIAKPKENETKGLWLLQARHADGSLEQFIANTRRKNLVVGFGILGLVAVSIILIFISVRRAQIFAKKQIDFVSAVSHEFRTPLAVIYSAGENLSDGIVGSEKQIAQYGGLIKGEGKKLSQMVEQILEFAGARSGRRKYDLRETEIETVIADALEACRSLIDEKDFTIETKIAENLPVISADARALSHAVQNLITNAVKYSDGDRRIKISARNGDNRVKITVEDRGIGIAPRDIKNIFEPFYRARAVVDAQIHGNGLGLSLVKQTVAAHGGKVSVESEMGKGSRFVIEIPGKSEKVKK